MTVSGTFTEKLSVVSRTSASLHLLTARVDVGEDQPPERVLLPFAEFRLGGAAMADAKDLSEEDDPPTLLAGYLTLENLAFMVLDLTRDLKRVCSEVTALGSGDLSVDPQRMAHVRYFAAHIERNARACRLGLDKAFGAPETNSEE
ncbi:hypothetical protein U1737_00005 [Sphingomonas sp. LB3N6]|uniref:hypothetical protein n=1 Tax=Sphingomonas fucosidasi TaxID=3096164 RepID=UPI002FCB699B